MQLFRKLGPGVLVSAAFIGPGTVTTSTLAGANFGFVLLWALVFATLATMVLQEMSARLGTVSQTGLGESLMTMLQKSAFKWPMIVLLLTALFIGNAAYEGGNLAGAAAGAAAIAGESTNVKQWALISLSLIAGLILASGAYRLIEYTLIGLVGLMALAFVATFLVVQPNMWSVVKGSLVPSIPSSESLFTITALVGTTVVPYNLFLHAAACKTKWRGEQDLRSARLDTAVSIGLGGLIAILIAATAAGSIFAQGLTIENASDMAQQFEPLFGDTSKILLGVGLMAAGLSSAITAPLATGFAISEIFGLDRQQHPTKFKFICLSILAFGSVIALSGIKPLTLIIAAQFANGLLLPIIAIFLLYVVNQNTVMGKHTNGIMSNVFGISVVLITTGLGIKAVLAAFARV